MAMTTGRAGDFEQLSIARTKLVRALHRKKERQAERAFLAEGERLLDELARHAAQIRFLFGVDERLPWLAERFPDAPIYRIGPRAEDLFATDSPQGIGAVVTVPEAPTLDDLLAEPGPVLFLDALADPGNVGTIIRTAVWFGLDRIALGRGCVDAYNPKVVRGTMGGIFTARIAEQVTYDEVIDAGRTVVALDGGGPERLGEIVLPRDAIFAIGSEAHGVAAELAAASRLVRIPGAGEVESLNAAIAAGILCYELSRLDERS
jgi:TrmH family RNA methyltransferase